MSAKILVAEDSEDAAILIKFTLEKAGFNVRMVTNGREALEVLQSEIPDLLITDILMPEMNGFELLQEIKKQNIKVKSVVLALQNSDEDIARGLSYGAIDYIQKPFNPREIVGRVQGILAR